MNSSKTLSIIVLTIAFACIFNACSQGKSPVEPTINNVNDIQQDVPISFSTASENRSVLAIYDAVIDPEAKTFTVEPVNRSAEYHFPLTQLYPNVLQITGYGYSPGLWADIKLQHPLPGSGIDAYDPRVIAILPANPGVSMNYPISDVLGNNSALLEFDGFTKLFDSVNPSIVGNTNPFKAYFKDEPNRVWSSTQTTEETQRWEIDLSGFGGPFEFQLVVDVSTNYPNPPQPIIDNASEPVQLETYIARDLSTYGGGSLIEVTLLDWQGEENTMCKVESPQLFNDTIELFYSREGTNPDEYVFSGNISNSLLAPIDNYDVLISASDILTGVQVFSEVAVSVNEINDGNLVWAKQTEGSSSKSSREITTLSDNSTVMTGYFNDSIKFGPGEINETILTSAGDRDAFIARYNPNGTLAWAMRAGGPNNEYGYGITTLSDDSTVVTGYCGDSAIFGLGEINETEITVLVGFRDIFIARYNPDGTLEWAKGAGGATYDTGEAVTALSDNSTVVTGNFEGWATFGLGESNETILSSAGDDDIFVARYNPDGTLAWAKCAYGYKDDSGYSITTLSDDTTVVTGYYWTGAIFGWGELNETTLTAAGSKDIFIARYNTDGTLQWAKSAGGDRAWDIGRGVTTLSDNSTVVTGYFRVSATFGSGESNETFLDSGGNNDIFVARFNPDGSLAWAKQAGGEGDHYSRGITVLSDNSTIVTGYFIGLTKFGLGESCETVLTTAEYDNIFVARYNPDGTLSWAKSADGTSRVAGYGITSLSNDSTVVTGTFLETVIFGKNEPNQTVLISTDSSDIFVARFQP